MGKSIPSPTRLQDFARVVASEKLHRPTHIKPISKIRPEPPNPRRARVESEQFRVKMEESSAAGRPRRKEEEEEQNRRRLPLAAVVSDCVKRWFQDTLKEAKAGDGAMQVLVGQMYYSGYGVPRDTHRGRVWLNRASKSRSSVWKVGDKRPGYNASDSDSEDTKGDAK